MPDPEKQEWRDKSYNFDCVPTCTVLANLFHRHIKLYWCSMLAICALTGTYPDFVLEVIIVSSAEVPVLLVDQICYH